MNDPKLDNSQVVKQALCRMGSHTFLFCGVESSQMPDSTSVIIGNGYGDSHDWEKPSDLQIWWKDVDGHLINPVGGPTIYRCRLCGVTFKHYYHVIEDIFEAIKDAGVLDICPRVGRI